MGTIIRNNKLMIVIGQFSLSLGILSFFLNTFVFGNNCYLNITTGVLLGLSLVLNLSYLIKQK
jgi:uncharacterized membrane protein YuzA (DUF378 family)